MMQLQGTISMKDAFTRPMKQATNAMEDFQQQMKYTTDANGRLRDANGKFVKGGKAVTSTFGGMTNAAGGFAGIAAGLPAALAGIGAGMAALDTINLAATFESQMSTIKALTGASGEEMKQMTDLALEMGAKTKYERCFTAA